MIQTKGLTKRFGHLTAVDDLSFAVAPGEVLGFLGPNGAGKSTTMKMIAGFIAPTAGTVTVCGHDIENAPVEARESLGYLPEGAPLYGEMTAAAFLEFIADIRGLQGNRRKARLDDVIGRLHLESVLDQTIETLSKGFRRRVGLAQAIIHEPTALILDEPTDGLDPNQKHEVRALIRDMAPDKIIIISTHILEEVHAVCNRAIIIDKGRLLADDTPHALEARSRYHNAVTIRLSDAAEVKVARDAILNLPQVSDIEVVDSEFRITAFPRDKQMVLPAVSELTDNYSWKVQELHLEAGRLDEVFRDITGGAS